MISPMIVIDSDVRIPRTKKAIRDTERRQKLFKRYADAHAAAYVIRPTRYSIRAIDGFMVIYDASDRICETASEKRIELRIKQMRDRVLSRD